MDIIELTEKMHAFVRSKGWYEADSKRPQTPRNLSISLAQEAAEILEHFQWNEDFDRDELADELADVALYLLQLASVSEEPRGVEPLPSHSSANRPAGQRPWTPIHLLHVYGTHCLP